MLRVYSVVVGLDAIPNNANIKKILQNGDTLNIIYFDGPLETVNKKSRIITYDQLADRLTNAYENVSVLVKAQDVYFSLGIYDSNDKQLNVTFQIAGLAWVKQFPGSLEDCSFDYARYIRLLLKMVEDFVIIKLETKDEWI